MAFGDIRLVAFDIDGTLCLGDSPMAGALATVSTLRSRYRIAYHTNNSAKTDRDVCEKLCRLGFPATLEDVHTSCSATARYLEQAGFSRLFVIGASGLRHELAKRGLQLVDDESADHVVVGMDVEINYKRISVALNILQKGGCFVACNADASFPVEGGRRLPGCGAMVGAVQGAAGRGPDFLVGKPQPHMLAQIATIHGLRPEEILVVGDSLESDIQMAESFGSPAILIAADPDDNPWEMRVADLGKLLPLLQG